MEEKSVSLHLQVLELSKYSKNHELGSLALATNWSNITILSPFKVARFVIVIALLSYPALRRGDFLPLILVSREIQLASLRRAFGMLSAGPAAPVMPELT